MFDMRQDDVIVIEIMSTSLTGRIITGKKGERERDREGGREGGRERVCV